MCVQTFADRVNVIILSCVDDGPIDQLIDRLGAGGDRGLLRRGKSEM